MQTNERSRMLGEMPMARLVPKISLPIMASMIVQAMYNVVDSIYVSRYDPDGLALTAVSLAYPFQMLMIALGVGMATGVASVMSRRLGERNPEEARRASWNGVFIAALSYGLFLLVGLFLSDTLLGLVVAPSLQSAAKIQADGAVYLRVVTTLSLGLFMSVQLERMLQTTGNTVLSMITQMSGALTNIILDPIMIFTLDMGVVGAAVATVIGQWVSMGVGLAFNQLKNPELRFALRECRIEGRVLKAIVAVGLPSTVMSAIGSVMNLGMNAILSGFEEGVANAAVNVLNVYFKLQSFIFMPVFGLGTGMIAIVGYNFGARNRARVYSAVKVALIWAISIMLAGLLLFQLFPETLMSIFESEEASAVTLTMTRLGVVALRTISLMFPIAAVGITLSNVFQAVGRGVYSMIVSILRQLAVLLPSAVLLKAVFGTVDAVWWSFLIAESIALVICLFFYRRVNRQMIAPLGEQA